MNLTDDVTINKIKHFTEMYTGWPRHREFGSYFFQTGKTQGILLWHREKF